MSDKNFANVELLLGFNGVDAATATTDEGPDVRTITFNGNAQLDTAQTKWGASSLLLDGTGDFLSVAHSNDFSVATGAFTMEAWVRASSFAHTGTILNKRSGAGAQEFSLSLTSGALNFAMFASGSGVLSISGPGTMVVNVWYHVMVTRSATAGVTRLFRDGVLLASATESGTPQQNTSPLLIGRDGFSAARDWAGWLDDIRFTSGVARQTADFTPPRGPYDRGKNTGSAAKRRPTSMLIAA